MPMKYLLGVDLGTSSTKSALYSVEGQLIAESTVEVPIYYPTPGVVEQDNDDFYQTAARTVRTCIQESGIEPSSRPSSRGRCGSRTGSCRPVGRCSSTAPKVVTAVWQSPRRYWRRSSGAAPRSWHRLKAMPAADNRDRLARRGLRGSPAKQLWRARSVTYVCFGKSRLA